MSVIPHYDEGGLVQEGYLGFGVGKELHHTRQSSGRSAGSFKNKRRSFFVERTAWHWKTGSSTQYKGTGG